MSCGIYKITNQINQKVYIGKSIRIERRWSQHKSEINNLQKQNHLYRAMRKYGIDNFLFEIIELCPNNNKILSEREKYWIQYYNSYQTGYNETRGGDGLFKYNPQEIYKLWDNGYSVLEITQILHCQQQTVYDNLKNYPTYSTEQSKNRANTHRKQRISELAAKRQSYPVYQYDIEGNFIAEYSNLTEAAQHFGYSRDNSITKVINESNRKLAYGYQWSKEKLDRMPPYTGSVKKFPIRNINTGQVFESIRRAEKWANTSHGSISKVLNGQRKSAGKMAITNEPLYWERI